MIIIIETKPAAAIPSSVWAARNEADYVARVAAHAEQRRSDATITTTADAIKYTQDSHGRNVQIIRKDEYAQTEGWPDAVRAAAERLGWLGLQCAATRDQLRLYRVEDGEATEISDDEAAECDCDGTNSVLAAASDAGAALALARLYDRDMIEAGNLTLPNSETIAALYYRDSDTNLYA